eukprot:TRINITY_DN68093_c1_g3_i2.p1 TRINITY_DN68093_c1_g3~~TRINITY_DN68093_c1_g3_i2.p1  ORF type:complete len:212 (-),score=23.28 TRINITY_DN68093_c1_g3_i2:691-1326(-)
MSSIMMIMMMMGPATHTAGMMMSDRRNYNNTSPHFSHFVTHTPEYEPITSDSNRKRTDFGVASLTSRGMKITIRVGCQECNKTAKDRGCTKMFQNPQSHINLQRSIVEGSRGTNTNDTNGQVGIPRAGGKVERSSSIGIQRRRTPTHIGQELLHQINMQKMWQEHGVEIDFDTRDDDDESDWSSSEEGGEWGDTGAFNKTYDSALEIATGL